MADNDFISKLHVMDFALEKHDSLRSFFHQILTKKCSCKSKIVNSHLIMLTEGNVVQ